MKWIESTKNAPRTLPTFTHCVFVPNTCARIDPFTLFLSPSCLNGSTKIFGRTENKEERERWQKTCDKLPHHGFLPLLSLEPPFSWYTDWFDTLVSESVYCSHSSSLVQNWISNRSWISSLPRISFKWKCRRSILFLILQSSHLLIVTIKLLQLWARKIIPGFDNFW